MNLIQKILGSLLNNQNQDRMLSETYTTAAQGYLQVRGKHISMNENKQNCLLPAGRICCDCHC